MCLHNIKEALEILFHKQAKTLQSYHSNQSDDIPAEGKEGSEAQIQSTNCYRTRLKNVLRNWAFCI